MNFSPIIKASGSPPGLFCSLYCILIPILFFSGRIFLNWFNCPLLTIMRISLIPAYIMTESG